MMGIYNLRTLDANQVNAERCVRRLADKYSKPDDCKTNINLPLISSDGDIVIPKDSYYSQMDLVGQDISTRCGSICYTDKVNSGGKWRIYDGMWEDDLDNEPAIAAYNAFSDKCSSKIHKVSGKESSCKQKAEVGRYIYNDPSTGPLSEQETYECGTCGSDVLSGDIVIFDYKLDSSGSILGTSKSKEVAECNYYGTKKIWEVKQM